MTSASLPTAYPKAVLFDLLTALLDSWTSWNQAAGSEPKGRAWRAAYLRRTYGCGKYIAYEQLVREAAAETGLPESAARALEADWLQLAPWSGALDTLQALSPHCKLAIVTNCSVHLGTQAAGLFPVHWDVIVTAEEAGMYKPDPLPYRLALAELGVEAHEAAFVAGSSYDMFGTAAVGLRTYWHNRVGLPLVAGAPPPEIEAPTLASLVPWLSRFGAAQRPSISR
jgi:2-haloalkanoic acid dehalogenase type II